MSEQIAPKRVRVHHLRAMKAAGQPITMLTAYDAVTADVFAEAGIDVLLVGDSVGDNLHGHATTLPVTGTKTSAISSYISSVAIIVAGR